MRAESGRTAHYTWVLVDEPVYCVEFTDSTGQIEPWRLVGAADVEQVMDWARARQRGREIAVSAEVQDSHGVAYLRLVGPGPRANRLPRPAPARRASLAQAVTHG